MFVTVGDLKLLLSELSDLAFQGQIQKIQSINPSGVQLTIRVSRSTKRILIFDDPRFPSAAIQSSPWRFISKEEGPLLQLMKKYLKGNRIHNISQVDNDRILKFEFSHCSLIVECIERFANLYLLDSDQNILASHLSPRNPLKIHSPYSIPRSGSGVESSITIDKSKPASAQIIQKIEEALQEKATRDVIRELSKEIKKKSALLKKIEKDREKASGSEQIRIEAELLKSSMHLIKPGSSSVEVVDYSTDPPTTRQVPIDTSISPKGYVEKLFRRYFFIN